MPRYPHLSGSFRSSIDRSARYHHRGIIGCLTVVIKLISKCVLGGKILILICVLIKLSSWALAVGTGTGLPWSWEGRTLLWMWVVRGGRAARDHGGGWCHELDREGTGGGWAGMGCAHPRRC